MLGVVWVRVRVIRFSPGAGLCSPKTCGKNCRYDNRVLSGLTLAVQLTGCGGTYTLESRLEVVRVRIQGYWAHW